MHYLLLFFCGLLIQFTIVANAEIVNSDDTPLLLLNPYRYAGPSSTFTPQSQDTSSGADSRTTDVVGLSTRTNATLLAQLCNNLSTKLNLTNVNDTSLCADNSTLLGLGGGPLPGPAKVPWRDGMVVAFDPTMEVVSYDQVTALFEGVLAELNTKPPHKDVESVFRYTTNADETFWFVNVKGTPLNMTYGDLTSIVDDVILSRIDLLHGLGKSLTRFTINVQKKKVFKNVEIAMGKWRHEYGRKSVTATTRSAPVALVIEPRPVPDHVTDGRNNLNEVVTPA